MNFCVILIEIYVFSFKKMHLKMPSAKWRPFCLGLDVLIKQNHNASIFPHIERNINYLYSCNVIPLDLRKH